VDKRKAIVANIVCGDWIFIQIDKAEKRKAIVANMVFDEWIFI